MHIIIDNDDAIRVVDALGKTKKIFQWYEIDALAEYLKKYHKTKLLTKVNV